MRSLIKGAEQLGVEYTSFDDLLAKSDFVILTCAATPQNKNLMNKAAFQKMKKTATLVNIARFVSFVNYFSPKPNLLWK